MLRLNISVSLSILYYLDILNSVTNNDLILEDYKKRLQLYKKENDAGKDYAKYVPVINYDICKKPIEKRTALCKAVIKRLRSSNEVYNNFYMNFVAFTVGEPCKEIKVWINQGEILAHQEALNCFGRSAIMSVDSSKEMVNLYQGIVIYPWNSECLMVFEYNQDKKYYMPMTIYRIFWIKLINVSNSLFFTPTPQSWREVSNLFEILYPIQSEIYQYSKNTNNIVNYSDTETLFKICNVVFRSENYNKQFNLNARKIKKPSPMELQATLQEPMHVFDLQVSILAYSCEYSVIPEDRTFMSKYHIAAGPGNHSVILLEEIESSNNDSPNYEIIEFVEYVTRKYIYLYFQRFY